MLSNERADQRIMNTNKDVCQDVFVFIIDEPIRKDSYFIEIWNAWKLDEKEYVGQMVLEILLIVFEVMVVQIFIEVARF